MKKLLLAAALLLGFSHPTLADLSEPDQARLMVAKNWATNGGAELGKTGWSVSGTSAVIADLALTTTAAGKYEGNTTFTWTPANADNYLTNRSVTITSGGGLSSSNCAALVWTKTTATTHVMEAYDGSAVLNSVTIPASTTFVPVSLNWVCSGSGTNTIRFNAGATTALSFDSLKWGDARGINLSQINQATLVGRAYIAATASSAPVRTNTALGAFTDTDTPGATVESNPGPGVIQTTDYNTAKFAVNALPPGVYEVDMNFDAILATSTQTCDFAINDGTTTSGEIRTGCVGNTDLPVTVKAVFSYTATGDRTFELYGASAANALSIGNSGTNQKIWFTIKRFPTTAQTVYTPEIYNWRVDANILATGAVSLGTGNNATYSGIENSALTLTNNTSTTANILTAMIPCSSTNAPTGTTCAAGNESVGVSFTLPAAGDIEACIDFTWQGDVGSGAAVGSEAAAFQIVETPNAAQTITQEGRGRSSANEQVATTNVRNIHSFPFHTCGTFSFTSAGQKTLRLFYEQAVTGTVNSSSFYADGDNGIGQRDAHWVVKPLTQMVPAPIIIGSTIREQHSHTSVAGYGSTNTTVIRFTNHTVTSGSGITYTSSAGNGDSWTVLSDGIYAMTGGLRENSGGNTIQIGRNLSGAQLTADPAGALSTTGDNGFLTAAGTIAGEPVAFGWTGFLLANDVIRLSIKAGLTFSTTNFTITKIGN